MPKLLDESQAVNQALEVASQYDGFDKDDAELIQSLIEGESDMKSSMSRLIYRYNEILAQIESIKKIKKRYNDRLKRKKKQIDRMKQYAQVALESAGIENINLPEATVYLSDARGGLSIEDNADLPDQYIRVKKSPDKRALRKAIESGEEIKGVSIEPSKKALNIRV